MHHVLKAGDLIKLSEEDKLSEELSATQSRCKDWDGDGYRYLFLLQHITNLCINNS